MRILITGGAGYIGSHTLLEVLKAGHEAHVVDNLSNASPVALAAVSRCPYLASDKAQRPPAIPAPTLPHYAVRNALFLAERAFQAEKRQFRP